MSAPDDQLPLKPADLYILLALSAERRHGYGIMKEVERESGGTVQLEIGSLYRLLGRLSNDGLIKMEESDGRRHYYSLTRLGKSILRAEAQRLARLVDLLRARKLAPRTDS
jgi:PadR family transcriptional regulator PadR